MGRVQNYFDRPQISGIISMVVWNWVMKFKKSLFALLVLISLFQFAPSSFGFALLGPFAPWMTTTNGFGPPQTTFANGFGDIGGPMNISDGYRWNIPIITYGFDKSFFDYFGTNGVAAVEGAIQILNDLPTASSMVLTNYPASGQRENFMAQAENLYDLKSMTLALLLEQMGLAQPTRFVYVLRKVDPAFVSVNNPFLTSQFWWQNGIISNQIVLRNFDPETLEPSIWVNNQLYSGYLYIQLWPDQTLDYAIPLSLPVNPLVNGLADADWLWTPSAGYFFSGLTCDDAGGLRYLLSADNVNYEKLLPDVHIFGPHRGGVGNGAWRPGVGKITFVPQPTWPHSRSFRPLVYNFTDAYLNNNSLRQRAAQRVIFQPDVLFCAADTGEGNSYPRSPWVVRTGTTNWSNYANLNGNTNGEGPGVIQPPIKITFHKLGPEILTGNIDDSGTYNQGWGSFDDSTNLPVVYPSGVDAKRNQLTVRLRFFDTDFSPYLQLTNITWHLKVPIGGLASLQISTNRIDWTSLATTTNSGSVVEWWHYDSNNPPKYFRVLPQTTPRRWQIIKKSAGRRSLVVS
jgi:hypothetical protein